MFKSIFIFRTLTPNLGKVKYHAIYYNSFSTSENIGINDVLMEGFFLTFTKYIAFFSFAIRNRFQVLTPSSIKKCLSVALQWLWFMIVCNAFFLFSLIYDCLRPASYLVKKVRCKYMFWAKSFTSLMADLCQEINGGFAFRRFLNGTFPREGIAPLRHWYINPNENSNKSNLLFWVNLPKRLM